MLIAANLFKLERDRGARDITVSSFLQAISCFSLSFDLKYLILKKNPKFRLLLLLLLLL